MTDFVELIEQALAPTQKDEIPLRAGEVVQVLGEGGNLVVPLPDFTKPLPDILGGEVAKLIGFRERAREKNICKEIVLPCALNRCDIGAANGLLRIIDGSTNRYIHGICIDDGRSGVDCGPCSVKP